jgi:hypothetical protein
MQTLAPPTLVWPEPSAPSCEGEKPQPLQGGADAGDRDSEKETGSEGDGP